MFKALYMNNLSKGELDDQENGTNAQQTHGSGMLCIYVNKLRAREWNIKKFWSSVAAANR